MKREHFPDYIKAMKPSPTIISGNVSDVDSIMQQQGFVKMDPYKANTIEQRQHIIDMIWAQKRFYVTIPGALNQDTLMDNKMEYMLDSACFSRVNLIRID